MNNTNETSTSKYERQKLLSFFNDINNKKIDLHLHSVFSVGESDVFDLLCEAAQNNLSVISITDNDTLKAYMKLSPEQISESGYTGEILFGSEITTNINYVFNGEKINKQIETLVYFNDADKYMSFLNNPKVLTKTPFPFIFRDYKIYRNLLFAQQKIDVINQLGLAEPKINLEDVIHYSKVDKFGEYIVEDNFRTFSYPIKSKEKGFLKKFGLPEKLSNLQEDLPYNNLYYNYFDQIYKENGQLFKLNFDYINSRLFNILKTQPNAQKYFEKYGLIGENLNATQFNRIILQNPDFRHIGKNDNNSFFRYANIDEVVDFTKTLGGVSIVAHPFKYKISSDEEVLAMVESAISHGIDGLEAFHGYTDIEKNKIIYDYCKDNGLPFTFGSDKHDENTTIGYASISNNPEKRQHIALSTQNISSLFEQMKSEYKNSEKI